MEELRELTGGCDGSFKAICRVEQKISKITKGGAFQITGKSRENERNSEQEMKEKGRR